MNRKPLLFLLVSVSVFTTATAAEDVKQEIIDRCRTQMSTHGAAIVKACVDQDVEALNSLNTYPGKYSAIVSRCSTQMRKHGFAIVKACVDQDIAAEEALNKY